MELEKSRAGKLSGARVLREQRENISSKLQSQPKVSGHPQKKALPRFPSFNVATMMSTFLSIFRAGGMGEKEATVQCYFLRL